MVAKKNSRASKETTLRHVWLAAIGAAVVARREARTAFEIAVEEAGKLRGRAGYFAADAVAVARGGLLTVAERVEPKLRQAGGDIETRLAPVLAKLGLTPKPRRPVRKARQPAAKSRRVARTPVKRARGVRR
ncbi:hypothetical protein M2650_02575 [Luteimonas sp. SX5]|uniref:Poly(Hydroxyalcanoate) granule associated protein n=1 Tax=Luteimonas galliterrae TaxID=2940486 RepID=A0ABT0MF79_9GAMM|nr:hypothetical protein [Luteimonas galliterrae]MCL1633531.1 hypothetical protein [Luteimonas galliterrae]